MQVGVHSAQAGKVMRSGLMHKMDIILYVLFGGDRPFVESVVKSSLQRMRVEFQVPLPCLSSAQPRPHTSSERQEHMNSPGLPQMKELDTLYLTSAEMPLSICISLFFFLVAIDCTLRYWVLKTTSGNFSVVDPYKAVRFVNELKNRIIPEWLSDEKLSTESFVRNIKTEYIRS